MTVLGSLDIRSIVVVPRRSRIPPRLAGTAVAFVCAVAFTLSMANEAHAYSNFNDYVRAIEMGGGGGRLFSGTPGDSYGCDVCHRGAEGAELRVIGLPTEGYVPGQAYEIAFQWPLAATDVALMAEVTDLAGGPAGAISLLPIPAWQPGEFCEDGVNPAADVCRAGDVDASCCIYHMGMSPDACAFPGERSVLWVQDCRSDFARMVWTAPSVPMDVWFSTEMVTSDLQFDAVGDGATSLRMRLQPIGASSDVTSAVGDCRVASRGSRDTSFAGGLTSLALLACCAVVWRRRARARRESAPADMRGKP